MEKNLGDTMHQDITKEMEQIIKSIVDSKTKDISEIVHKIQTLLRDDTPDLTDAEIDDILLQLPIVLYDSMEEQ